MYRVFSDKVIFYLFLLHIIDIVIAPVLRVGMVQPVFVYLLIVYAGVHWGGGKAIHISLLGGLLRDMTSSQFLGMETLTLSSLSLLLEGSLQKVDKESSTAKFGLCFLYVFAACSVTLVLTCLSSSEISISWAAFMSAVYTAFYTACLMPIFFWFTSGIFHDKSALRQYELFR